ncbi:hypothetical protein DNFV4_03613 [Nitrospira tepida]|uniref:Uncharacterized protein n=1 Tax=Nitrospira tepida TaxID=2973512 RepID=A0AA86T6N9_9BACT|nr:hypothetical protein DNFV4_03613 [Nitrospira tepida]
MCKTNVAFHIDTGVVRTTVAQLRAHGHEQFALYRPSIALNSSSYAAHGLLHWSV